MKLSASAVQGEVRPTSLRIRWNRTFALLVSVLVVCGLASLSGIGFLVGTFRVSAVGVERDASLSASVRADVVAHAVLISNSVVMTPDVTAAGATARAAFVDAIASETHARAKALLGESFAEWQAMTTAANVAGDGGDLVVRGGLVSAEVPKILALLDQAGSVSRAAVRVDLADATDLVRGVMVVLAGLGLLAIGLSVRLARRLSTEVLKPVGVLRESANHLAAGELDHRIVVDRADELGELAISFNAMADAIAGSHRSLALEANTDSLSGLANRAAFRARLEASLARSERRAGSQAVLFVDLDDFKDVNDTLGHNAGDALLCVVAERLNDAVRPGDLVARLGGDEFALLLDGLIDPSVAFTIASRIVASLSDPVQIGLDWAHVGASVGVSMVRDGSTVEGLMREADVAMYAAKGNGKHRVERYDAALDDLAMERQGLRADLAGAAGRGELVVDYQPVVDLDSGLLAGVEALVRWQHPTRGLLPPSEFIELAEASGAILGIGSWVLETSLRQLRSWQRRYSRPELWVSVNVSVCQLDAQGFADQVKDLLQVTGVGAGCLVLEVTESVLAGPGGGAAATLDALRGPGVRVALDDFGTGYSSIAYLRELPVDVIKIDRSFVSGSDAGASDNALLEAIVAMGEHLGLDVIPEGIETPEQLSRLIAMGCHVGQGFLLSRPMAADAIEVLLASPLPWPAIALSEAVGHSHVDALGAIRLG